MVESAASKHWFIRSIRQYSLLLVLGTIAALLWANLAPSSYAHLVHTPLSKLILGGDHPELEQKPEVLPPPAPPSTGEPSMGQGKPVAPVTHEHHFNLEFLVNDILMAFFFAIAAKEVWEALLPGGSLSNPRRAATPLFATAGGILGPALVYIAVVAYTGHTDELQRGWAVPCATDIAFSLLVARFIFGFKHPAISFLLLLAIADDAAGLLILATFYPRGDLHPEWLMLTFCAFVFGMAMQRNRWRSYWWYLAIPGTISWLSFYWAGIHPALGLVPIIPTLPHAATDWGIYEESEEHRIDTLNQFEHAFKLPVEVILGAFGLVNAGVQMASVGAGTWAVVIALFVGKPLGIIGMTGLAEYVLKLDRPTGVDYRHVTVIGLIGAVGFTVSLFVATAAFPLGRARPETLDAVKMGALLSFGAIPLAVIVAKILRIRPEKSPSRSGLP